MNGGKEEMAMIVQPIIKRRDMINCVLCSDAPCTAACPLNLQPAELLRSIWFDGESHAALSLPKANLCSDCQAPCEKVCLRRGLVPIKKLLSRLHQEVRPVLNISLPANEEALRTELCGIPLENPFLLSSSVVSSTYEMCARAFEAGWAGAVLKTICNFAIHEASPRFAAISADSVSITGFKNIEQLSVHSLTENMELIRRLKQAYPQKAIVASIMGCNEEEWGMLARLCQENKADAIELNFSCPNMADDGLGSDIGQCPDWVERFTAAARRGASIPILAKLTPNVASMSPAAEAAKKGGANGLCAINTIKSIMRLNPDTYVSSPCVQGISAVGGYSGNAVKPIALRFIAELGKNPRLAGMPISGMGGIETWRDALEFLLLGAGSVQVTTSVMQYGYRIIDDLKAGLNYYLREKSFQSVNELVGLGLDSISESTDVLERDSIVYPKFQRQNCIGCGRCKISCDDGGHQAIGMKEGRPLLNPKKCVGCHLCILVCPINAILPSGKRIKLS
ncbi:MAG: NAD-dependent dihydropyrimidine dehydrogenase subunit PreA [Desulfovibrio sp.]|nr:NAD-dependent dihydropyrimidine dehydrogenase subunit PreA [Desulfovibrio sp.]